MDERLKRLKEIIMELKEINEDVHMGDLEYAISHLQKVVDVMQGNENRSYIDILMQYTFF